MFMYKVEELNLILRMSILRFDKCVIDDRSMNSYLYVS